mmetsp:Transcript_1339/g.3260  ORF Transcript_1339/g.3260 Transcript_1339/m.3260 type:complete len:604 (-) Transcript_1339:290-2101(-)|eukprot:CAMPEP_0170604396 /NCGR_PEP_ID=MMETSP0224-20130122/19399_1 /TAXON_ID=285029 /ORGANISM="Togula jolla, Strain CCCM 725" /LENGTH=603 /DNA_ID=CAMNT_0010929293 /DNA_START=137 /DNA_END=1948 /DNA_ORIENTATION=-
MVLAQNETHSVDALLSISQYVPSEGQSLDSAEISWSSEDGIGMFSDSDWAAGAFEAVLEGAFAIGALVFVMAVRKALQRWYPRASKAKPKMTGNKNSSHDNSCDSIANKAQLCRSVPAGKVEKFGGHSPSRRTGPTSEADFLAGAVCAGKVAGLPALLDAARERAMASCPESELDAKVTEHLLSALRACASRKFFREALTSFDHVAQYVGEGSSGIWSLLLYCAAETGEYHRCLDFTDRLCSLAVPSGLDFVNVVRCYAHLHDTEGLIKMLGRLETMNLRIDAITRNRALSACATCRAWDMVEPLMKNKLCTEAMDAVSYNTLMKGHVQAGSPTQCYQVYEELRASGLQPSEITFGILLDACIDARDFDRARTTFAELRSSGLTPNVVHYTTFMKGLLSAGHLDEATDLLEEMLGWPGTQPDLVTYTTLVKAHSDCGSVRGAFRVLDRMSDQGVIPDSVILNVALSGCCAKPLEAAQVFQVLRWLTRRHGLQASTTTLSILMKALSLTGSWDDALELLDTAPERLGLWPEKRIYLQLAQGCARAKCGPKILAVYEATVKAARLGRLVLDEESSSRLFRLCVSCGQKAAATKILQEASALDARK